MEAQIKLTGEELRLRQQILRQAALRSVSAVAALFLAIGPLFTAWSYDVKDSKPSAAIIAESVPSDLASQQAVQDEKIANLEKGKEDEVHFREDIREELRDLRQRSEDNRDKITMLQGMSLGIGGFLSLLQGIQALGLLRDARGRKRAAD